MTLRPFKLLSVLVVCHVGAGCATLNTMGMSPQCRDLYDSCLNGCPKPNNRMGDHVDLDINTASCTNACNEQAKQCH